MSLSLFRSVFLECKYIYLECKYILGCVNLMHRNKILLFWIHYVLNNIKRSFKLPLIKHLNYIFCTHKQLGCLYFSLDDEMVKFTLLAVFFFHFSLEKIMYKQYNSQQILYNHWNFIATKIYPLDVHVIWYGNFKYLFSILNCKHYTCIYCQYLILVTLTLATCNNGKFQSPLT